jgi:arylsulfatase A-like enzyme
MKMIRSSKSPRRSENSPGVSATHETLFQLRAIMAPALARLGRWACLSALLLCFPGLLRAAATESLRPNLLFVLADDLRWDAVGFMGDRVVKTPHLDRLAKRGTIFRNAFVTTSICCVSRASLLSGQSERRHRIADFATPFTSGQWASTYPALLRQSGYRTGFIGKFGVGNAAAIRAMAREFDFWRGLPGQGGLFIATNDPTRTHATSRFGDQALEFVSDSNAGAPWCLSLSFTAPHARDGQPREFMPDVRDESLYSGRTVKEPFTATDEFFYRLPGSVRASEARKRWGRRFATAEMFQSTVKDYYRLITGIDREVGRIISLLEERGMATNTVIIFTSDNGFALGDRGLAGKWFLYEESIRVPLFIADLRKPRGRHARTADEMVLNIDIAPTLLNYAGVPAPEGMQGRSLRGIVEKKRASDWRTDWFYEHHFGPKILPPSEGVVTERWKYVRWIDETPVIEELFDRKRDRFEASNLAGNSKHASTLNKLRDRWKALGEEWK